MSIETRSPSTFDSLYSGTPPWDIGRPQPAIAALVGTGEIRGSVLDVGCGTGEHVLLLAAAGHDAWGIDTSKTAIAKAEAKARDRGVRGAVFRTANALALDVLGRTFDTVIDSGVFHVFSDADRDLYAKSLGAVLRSGGAYFTLVFSDREPLGWGGPRRIAEGDFARTFGGGWRVAYVKPSKFETNMGEHRGRGGGEAWLARIDRE
jgi:SAM-dependent methyltransferase